MKRRKNANNGSATSGNEGRYHWRIPVAKAKNSTEDCLLFSFFAKEMTEVSILMLTMDAQPSSFAC